MCQLSFVNLNHMGLNRLFTVYQMMVNSEFQNKDGYGIFTIDNFFKSEKTPTNVTNFGAVIGDRIVSKNPILAHVRAATNSYGTSRKEVCVKNSHPFDLDNIVLAHNGSLESNKTYLNTFKELDFKDKIDSEIFGMILNKVYSDDLSKPFGEAFNDVMNNFTGKFAFIIYNKIDLQHYIIRGFTAKLYITYLSSKTKTYGYIVNTDDTSLEKSLKYCIQLAQALYNIDLEFTTPRLVDAENIYIAKKSDLEVVGKTKENFPKLVSERTNTSSSSAFGYDSYDYRNQNVKNSHHYNNEMLDLAKKESELLLKAIERLGLSPEELNILFMTTLGGSFLSLDRKDLELFLNQIVPVLQEKTSERKRNLWITDIIKKASYAVNIYNKYELEFPYMYNSYERLEEVAKQIKAESQQKSFVL